MTAPTALDLTKRLIAQPSITPATGPVFDEMEAMLTPLGFEISRFIAGEAPDGPVEKRGAMRAAARVGLVAWATTARPTCLRPPSCPSPRARS